MFIFIICSNQDKMQGLSMILFKSETPLRPSFVFHLYTNITSAFIHLPFFDPFVSWSSSIQLRAKLGDNVLGECVLAEHHDVGVEHIQKLTSLGIDRYVNSGLHHVVGVGISDHEDDNRRTTGTHARNAIIVDRLKHRPDYTRALLLVAVLEQLLDNVGSKLLTAQREDTTRDDDTEQTLTILDPAVLQHMLNHIVAVLFIKQRLVTGEQRIEDIALLRLDAVLEDALEDAAAVRMTRQRSNVLQDIVNNELNAVSKEVAGRCITVLESNLGLVAKRLDNLLHYMVSVGIMDGSDDVVLELIEQGRKVLAG